MAAGLEKREKFIKASPNRGCLAAANSGTGMRWLSFGGSGSVAMVAVKLLAVWWRTTEGGRGVRLAAAAWSSEKKSEL
jgi:hypothetical protein